MQYEVFGETITTFRERRDAVTKAIWSYSNKGNGQCRDTAMWIEQALTCPQMSTSPHSFAGWPRKTAWLPNWRLIIA